MKLASRIDIDRWIWCVNHYAIRLGWQGVLGGLLILLCLIAVPAWLQPAWTTSQQIRDQAALLSLNMEQHQGVQYPGTPAAQLAGFYDFFPGTDSIADTLDRIYLAATENSIVLNQGDYSLTDAEGGVLQRYEVSVPVRGKYAQVRNFIARVLSEHKNAALLSVSVTRNSAADAGVEAQLRFAIYLRDAP